MPGYSWKNLKTGSVVDIIRRFSEYEDPPTIEESGLTPEEYAEAEWERVLLGSPTINRPWHWQGKGNW